MNQCFYLFVRMFKDFLKVRKNKLKINSKSLQMIKIICHWFILVEIEIVKIIIWIKNCLREKQVKVETNSLQLIKIICHRIILVERVKRRKNCLRKKEQVKVEIKAKGLKV